MFDIVNTWPRWTVIKFRNSQLSNKYNTTNNCYNMFHCHTKVWYISWKSAFQRALTPFSISSPNNNVSHLFRVITCKPDPHGSRPSYILCNLHWFQVTWDRLNAFLNAPLRKIADWTVRKNRWFLWLQAVQDNPVISWSSWRLSHPQIWCSSLVAHPRSL